MEAKIFVIGFPSVSSVMEKITSAIEEAFEPTPKRSCKCKAKKAIKCYEDESLLHPWDVNAYEPMGKDLRFGAGFNIDEPRACDYDSRYEFESDHAAFDRFVDAGEDCVARGLEKTSKAPIHKCNAIRKKINEAPPIGIDLIGETEWWCEDCLDDDWF